MDMKDTNLTKIVGKFNEKMFMSKILLIWFIFCVEKNNCVSVLINFSHKQQYEEVKEVGGTQIHSSQEEFEDTKGVIRIRNSKDRQHNDIKKGQKDKQLFTKHTHKFKDWVTAKQLLYAQNRYHQNN